MRDVRNPFSAWESVPDVNSDEQHQQWDEEVLRLASDMTPQDIVQHPSRALLLMACILTEPDGHYNRKKTSPGQLWKTCEESAAFREGLAQALHDKCFRAVRLLKLFRKHNDVSNDANVRTPQMDVGYSQCQAWASTFCGTAHRALWEHILRYSHADHHLHIYPVIGPAGVGKSRVLDQFSLEHFVIPLNLSTRSPAYPPPDALIIKWINEETHKIGVVGPINGSTVKIDGERTDFLFWILLAALFQATKEVIEEGIRRAIESESMLDIGEKETLLSSFPTTLAAQFRAYMTIGQSTEQPGVLRKKFYERVIRRANSVRYASDSVTEKSVKTQRHLGWDELMLPQELAQYTARDLLSLVAEHCEYGGHRSSIQHIAVAIDDGGEFQSPKTSSNGSPWSQLLSFMRAFRALHRMPVDCLIATRRWSLFERPPERDQWRWHYEFKSTAPFCSIGFDELVGPDKFVDDGSWTLEKVTKEEFWVKLGRPSWALHYAQRSEALQSNLADHVTDQLLGGSKMYQYAMSCLDDEERFAILSSRLGLEFKPTSRPFIADAEDCELRQVQKHLRVVLDMVPLSHLRTTLTVSPSEPTVVEAASRLMRREGFHAGIALYSILLRHAPPVSRGFHGDIVVASVILDTLDNCTFDHFGQKTRFIVPVKNFLEALLPQDSCEQLNYSPSSRSSEHHTSDLEEMFQRSSIVILDTLDNCTFDHFGQKTRFIVPVKNFLEALLPQDSCEQLNYSPSSRSSEHHTSDLEEMFQRSSMALDLGVLRREILIRYVVRGAGIICSSKDGRVDLVLPFLYSGNALTATNVSAVLVRVRNATADSPTSHLDLQDDMNPYTLGMFPEGEALPVIRIFVDVKSRQTQHRSKDPVTGRYIRDAPPQVYPTHHSKLHRGEPPSGYTSFDVWCHGLSSKTFRTIKPEHDKVYQDLQDLTLSDDARDCTGNKDDTLRADMIPPMSMSMWPGATSRDESWSNFVKI
ncbi:hypothetical protein CERSUDRAFT_122386 [Gelatoporia subvermispora B]|uniref:Uncharacterized protein n=1 Tax=Ceriporiopsis subvermispora (strain B) TaxID=914234 RepID=M2QP41_CERS8|nr:hypothetical protein CERSUDRAFT_122386 [Gelatoporia subvermispora B]